MNLAFHGVLCDVHAPSILQGIAIYQHTMNEYMNTKKISAYETFVNLAKCFSSALLTQTLTLNFP